MPKLVKDLWEDRIVLYWINDEGDRISPHLPSITLAEEWWLLYNKSLHRGQERRHSHIDRRRLDLRRARVETNRKISSIRPHGRRATDRQISVDIDLSLHKLSQLIALHDESRDSELPGEGAFSGA